MNIIQELPRDKADVLLTKNLYDSVNFERFVNDFISSMSANFSPKALAEFRKCIEDLQKIEKELTERQKLQEKHPFQLQKRSSNPFTNNFSEAIDAINSRMAGIVRQEREKINAQTSNVTHYEKIAGTNTSYFSYGNQFKYSPGYRVRELYFKPILRTIIQFILFPINVFRRLFGFKEITQWVPCRGSVPNQETALNAHVFTDLSDTTQAAKPFTQYNKTSLKAVLCNMLTNIKDRAMILGGAPFYTFYDRRQSSVSSKLYGKFKPPIHNMRLQEAFEVIHEFLQENPKHSFAELTEQYQDKDFGEARVIQDLQNFIEKQYPNHNETLATSVKEILTGRHYHAGHPLTNSAQMMYTNSQCGKSDIVQNDMFTKDIILAAENQYPIYFINNNNELVRFDPNGISSGDKKKITVNVNKKSIEVHEVLYKDKKDDQPLAISINGDFIIYGGNNTQGENCTKRKYKLLGVLNYCDNQRVAYDLEYHHAIAKCRKEQDVFIQDSEKKGQEAAVMYNCRAGSNRSQWAQVNYIMEKFLEEYYVQSLQKQKLQVDLQSSATDLDQVLSTNSQTFEPEKHLYKCGIEMNKYLTEHPYSLPLMLMTALGLETQCSQFSQAGFEGNLSTPFRGTETKMCPYIDFWEKAMFRQYGNNKSSPDKEHFHQKNAKRKEKNTTFRSF